MESTRNLLGYFFESKIWKAWYENRVTNREFWRKEDARRSQKMYLAHWKGQGKIGITVADYVYDVLECIHDAKLANATKKRLYTELDIMEQLHIDNKTIGQEI